MGRIFENTYPGWRYTYPSEKNMLVGMMCQLPPPPPPAPPPPAPPPPLLLLLVLLVVLLVVLVVLAQLRPAIHSVRCSTTTIHAQCSLPDLNHDHPRPVFPAGPQPRPSAPSVPCRTSTTTIRAQCSLPDLNRDHPRPVFPAGPQPRVSTPSVPLPEVFPAGPHVGRYGTKPMCSALQDLM